MDKRQSTAAGWVSPVAIQAEQSQQQGRNPSFRGETNGLRITIFFALAFCVALALGWLAYTWWGMAAALAMFVALILVVFVPLYWWDSMVSTGYLHRRAELINESEKTWAALETTALTASQINDQQQAQIEQIWTAIHHIDERLKAQDTIKIQSRDGVRHVAKHDEIDSDIDRWLASMFDANGQMVGAHPSGSLKGPYPFKGDGDAPRQAHQRLIRAGLVGQNATSKQYVWTGPMTLSEARKRLYPAP
jgi:hypothetical protein